MCLYKAAQRAAGAPFSGGGKGREARQKLACKSEAKTKERRRKKKRKSPARGKYGKEKKKR